MISSQRKLTRDPGYEWCALCRSKTATMLLEGAPVCFGCNEIYNDVHSAAVLGKVTAVRLLHSAKKRLADKEIDKPVKVMELVRLASERWEL